MHITNGNYPVGNTAIPLADPNWDSNTSQGKGPVITSLFA